jgi:uncharacterized membrane protein YecN with MAPEG domain
MPVITSIYAALAALLVIALALLVVDQRRRSAIGLGDGGDRALQQRMRVHANAVENLPLALLLLLLLELDATAPALLHAFGGGLLLARVLHAWGFLRRSGVSFGRFAGTLATWLLMIGMALLLLWRHLL